MSKYTVFSREDKVAIGSLVVVSSHENDNFFVHVNMTKGAGQYAAQVVNEFLNTEDKYAFFLEDKQ